MTLEKNTVDGKDYYTLIFKDGKDKERVNFIGNIADFDSLKEYDRIDVYCQIYRAKENYYKLSGLVCYKVEKSLEQETQE